MPKKTIEMLVKARVPDWMTAAQARREVKTLVNEQCNYLSFGGPKDAEFTVRAAVIPRPKLKPANVPGFTAMLEAIGELIHNRMDLDLHDDDKLMLAEAWAEATGTKLPECDDCGETCLEVTGCPDGAEVCDHCLDGH